MKRISILLIMLMAMLAPLAMMGQSTTVTASRITSSTATWTGTGGESWSVVINGGTLNQAVTNGYAQYGQRNGASTSGTFSTSGISGTITSIDVDCASYNGLGTVSVTVGGAAFGSSQSIPRWSNNAGGTRNFTGSASGNIVVTMTNGTNGRAMYIKSITVTYTTTPSISLPAFATVLTGSTQTLTATVTNVTGTPTITYSSSNTSVATVSGSGTSATVTGVADGTATITASMTVGGVIYSATCDVTVESCGTIGTGTSTTNRVPINTYYNYFTTQSLYTASEINAAIGSNTLINSLSFYHNAQSATYSISIYLAHTTQTALSASTAVTSAELVYSGNNITVGGSAAGWQSFDLDTPFEYNGTDNLLVIVCGSGSYNVSLNWTYTETTNSVLHRGNDSTSGYGDLSNGNSTYGYTLANMRPNIKICGTAPGAYTITCATTTGGTISADKNNADENDVVTITATPDTEYLLTALTYTPEGGTAQSINIASEPYTFTMPAANVTVNATFTLPACPRPTDVTVNHVTYNSAEISWESIATDHELEYAKLGLMYNFDDGSLQGWTNLKVNSNGGEWISSDNNGGGYDYTTEAHSGECFAMSYSYVDGGGGSYNTDVYLVSPQCYEITSSSASLNYFYAWANPTYPDYLEVCVSTAATPTASSFTSLGWSVGNQGSGKGKKSQVLQNKNRADWNENTLSLSSYVGQSIWIAFHHKANDQYEIWIDDVTVNLGNSSWIPAPGPGPITSPYILEGLDSETQYAVRVKAICGGTDGESAWSDAVSFMTDMPCATPYNLNITNITAVTATLKWTGYQDSYNVKYGKLFFYDNFDENHANDWTQNDGGVYNWTGTTDYFVMLGMASSGTQYLITPDLSDIAGGNILEFSQRYYQGSMTFYVGYSSTTSNTSAFTWGSAITASHTAMSHIENIPTGTKYIAIRTTATNSNYGLVIDEFRIYSQTSTTANADSLNIAGLETNSNYFWQVQGVNCDGNGGTTRWSAPATFTTLNGITVTATADPTGSGTFAFTGSGVISSNATSALVNPTGDVTITATGAAGYTFMNWSEGGSTVSTSNPYTLTGVNATHSLTAHFVDMTAGDTWPTAVTSLAATSSGYSESGGNITISNENGLAWLISTVNGLNGQSTALSGKTITLTADVDMSAHDWVPIGTTERPFTCTFEGNGHIIKGVTCSNEFPHKGLFGYVSGAANIQNVVVQAELSGNSTTMGAIAGTFASTGTISNVEGAGTLTGGASTTSMGGLVGQITSGTIHSSFAVNTMSTTNSDTYIGGLVGVNHGNLLNSYANTTMSGSTRMGGLVGENGESCLVENCYAVIGSQAFPAFAYINKGTIQYCYADNANSYVGNSSTTTPTGHGTYSATQNTHTYGYMYGDNTVSIEGGTNPFKVSAITYANNQIDRWPGLLSTLENWVETTNDNTSLFPAITFTKWLRPTTKYINDDLPVLCFPRDNCMLTIDSEGKALRYGPFDGNSHSTYISRGTVTASLGNQGFGQEPQGSGDDNNNGIDDLLEENPSGYLFVYDNAINVERVPNANLFVFINEDVVFKQAASAGAFINTQVGVTFDNSCGTATDFFLNELHYDWHMLSTPLANAPLGFSYDGTANNWWDSQDDTQLTGVSNSYMPNGTDNDHHWDFYSFYEPEYHWINLKRNSSSHYHYDEPHDQITYTNESNLVPGKGYMTAIDQDSYLCNTGTLNGPSNPVSITLTKRSHDPGIDELGFNLLGNPYQAYLDVNGFLGRNDLTSYWVYIAESNNYIAGNTDASSNSVLPSATLHPHQGFFVLASSDGQTVSFDYSSMALNNPVENSYFRGGKVNYPLLNLFVANDNGMKDLAVIEFHRPKTGGSKKMRAFASTSVSTRVSILPIWPTSKPSPR